MANSMISVRIPASLVDELKEVSKKDHFLDLSEAVRSIIRENWIKQKDPVSHQIKQLRNEISENISKKGQEDFILELKKIRDSILSKKDGKDEWDK